MVRVRREWGAFAVLAVLVSLGGCASVYQPMDIVEKQVGEGRLVPEGSLGKAALLDGYSHFLPTPQGAVGIDVKLSPAKVLESGGTAVLQVGVTARAPQTLPEYVHVLVKEPKEGLDEAMSKELRSLVEGLRAQWGDRVAVSVDWSRANKPLFADVPSLRESAPAEDLKGFVKPYLVSLPDYQSRHFVLVVAGSTGLGQRDRRDLVDMAGYLRVKGATVSTVAIGDKPELALLRDVAEAGGGMAAVPAASFDWRQWAKRDLSYASASALTELEVRVALGEGVQLHRPVAPLHVKRDGNAFAYTIEGMRQGEERVRLFELEIAPADKRDVPSAVQAAASAFDAATQRYVSTRHSVPLLYTPDRNDVHAATDPYVERSLLILATADVIDAVARDMRERRTFKAMSRLAAQREKLESTGRALGDESLLADAGTLQKYEQSLYEFSGEYFQGLQSFYDLNIDRSRVVGSGN